MIVWKVLVIWKMFPIKTIFMVSACMVISTSLLHHTNWRLIKLYAWNKKKCWVWWCLPVFCTTQEAKVERCRFKVSTGYIVSRHSGLQLRSITYLVIQGKHKPVWNHRLPIRQSQAVTILCTQGKPPTPIPYWAPIWTASPTYITWSVPIGIWSLQPLTYNHGPLISHGK